MLTSILIDQIGPHRGVTQRLDPAGITEIAGPSESGKTSILTAISWAIWGRDLYGKPIDTDAFGAHAVVEISAGKSIRRESKNGRVKRELDGETHATEEAFAAATKRLGARVAGVPAGLLILSPVLWAALAEGPGSGRGLRDAIVGLLPGDDRATIAEIMAEGGHEAPGDHIVTDPKAAEARRRDLRASCDRLSGELAAVTRAVAEASAPAGAPDDPAPHLATIAAFDARRWWATRHAAFVRYTEAVGRIASLGERPAPVDLATLQTASDTAREAATKATDRTNGLMRRQNDAHTAATSKRARTAEELAAAGVVAALERDLAASSDACASCGQGLPDAGKHRAVLLTKLADAKRSAKAAGVVADEAHAAKVEAAKAEVEGLAAEVEAAKAAGEVAREAMHAARDALTAARTVDPSAQWDAKRRLLAEPVLSDDPGPAPPEVSVEAGRAAQAALDVIRGAEGAAKERARAAAEATKRHGETEAKAAKAAALSAWADALLDAVREAPGRRFASAVKAMGDTGPVTVELDGDGLSIKIDGRPWRVASSGRKVYAGAKLREGIRRLARMAFIPIGIDDAGLWSGEFDVKGPAIVLRTVSP